MGKHFRKLKDGKWKVYIQRFADQVTEQFLYVKPGITQYKDANARIHFNSELEEVSFTDHFIPKCIWSVEVPSKSIAEEIEKELLKHFGNPISEEELGFKTSGWTELRRYNQTKVNEAFEMKKNLNL